MNYTNAQLWERFKRYYLPCPEIGLALDISRMNFPDDFFSSMQERMDRAFAEMAALEKGAVANPDEKRMVGHYWLRSPALAPNPDIRNQIENAVAAIRAFAADVHAGKISGAAGPFKKVLLIGIGGSALGPQFVASALGHPRTDRMQLFFSDNTDPDGMDRLFAQLEPDFGSTLCIVISKSGGTKETRNGMLEAEAAYRKAGLNFGRHTVAITSQSSELAKYAAANEWLAQFPMWDWVGGRTSELSAVGLLPAALQGLDIEGMLAGAKDCDAITRRRDLHANPAAQLALMWYFSGNGQGERNMVVLPYKDRLELFSKYLQQLIMESLGKRLDRAGREVCQGLTVLGNKGSTDQHSYIQQLRDGPDDFFATFIEVLRDRSSNSMEVEPKVTSGDYLSGFYQGTRRALFESGKGSITITCLEVDSRTVGALIALFERTVGLYAALVNVNAYHQPGVEAGKKAASAIISLQSKVLQQITISKGEALSAEQVGAAAGTDDVEAVYKILEHLAANPDRGIRRTGGELPSDARYGIV